MKFKWNIRGQTIGASNPLKQKTLISSFCVVLYLLIYRKKHRTYAKN